MTRSLTLEETVERYLKERRANVSDSTLYNHSSQLSQFLDWIKENSTVENVDELDSFHISDFQLYRRDEDDLANITLYNQMTIIRVFIKWCESRGLVEDLAHKIMMPTVENESDDEKLEPSRANTLLQELEKYDYASMRHTMFALLWTTGVRLGTLRALDVNDYDREDQFLLIRHRPDSETPLKNKSKAERQINLHEWVCEILDDYIADRRYEVSDEYGREPLLTTSHGRPHRTTLRKKVRTLTRPCELVDKCPFDRNISTCEATRYNKAAQCPGSVAPHSLRRSAITRMLNEGHQKELISERMDVSVSILNKHYDARTESEKRELRREMFGMD